MYTARIYRNDESLNEAYSKSFRICFYIGFLYGKGKVNGILFALPSMPECSIIRNAQTVSQARIAFIFAN